MDTAQTIGLKDLLVHIVGDLAKAVSERPGESEQQQFDRTRAAVQMIMAFEPRDAIEAMLAGHCVMFHEMIVDSVQRTLRGEDAPALRATRGTIVAMDKAFGDTLTHLRRCQTQRREEARPAGVRAETETADRVRRHEAQAASGRPTDGQTRERIVPGMASPGVTPTHTAPATTISATTAG